jgi:hypothetical protein
MPAGMVKTKDRDDVGDDQRNDRSDMRLDLAAGDHQKQRNDRHGRRDRRQRGIAERIIDLIPHVVSFPERNACLTFLLVTLSSLRSAVGHCPHNADPGARVMDSLCCLN